MQLHLSNMQNKGKLEGYTVFITGASRGIGKAVALKVARDGANVVIAAKTVEPHPSLPGTIYTAAREVEEAGGKALPCIVDIRKEHQVQAAIDKAIERFGGIDILVNNASAITLTNTENTTMKKYDLMHQINSRGTYLCSKLCLPHLIKSRQKGRQPHILNMAPPLNMSPDWFDLHGAYSMAKYGMSMCTLAMAAEFSKYGIAVNSLWPRNPIVTAAVLNQPGGEYGKGMCRTVDIVADASYAILIRDSAKCSGNFFIDDNVLRQEGIKDFDQYAVDPTQSLADIVNIGREWRAMADVANQMAKL